MPTPDTDPNDRVDISPDRISVSFDLTADDMATFYRGLATTDPAHVAARKNAREHCRVYAVVGVLAAAVIVANVLCSFTLATQWQPGNVAVAIVATVVCVLSWAASGAYRDTVRGIDRKATKTPAALDPELLYEVGAWSIDIRADAITLQCPHADSVARWTGLTDVRHTPDSIYFVRLDRRALLIPKRVFTAAQSREVLERCRAWLDGFGHGDVERARVWLTTHDAHCPQCRYNLRGGDGRACSECGHEFPMEFIAEIANKGDQRS